MGLMKYIKHPWLFIIGLQNRGMGRMIRDSVYIKCMFRYKMGKWPNLRHPITFNEKLQWLKLHDRKPLYTKLVDKYAVKEYVSKIIGEEYVIPTLGVWNSFDEIDFSKLPNRFVLKSTHDSGGIVICKNKDLLDYKKVKEKIDLSMNTDFYLKGREWPYKNVQRRIIAEQYMEDDLTSELRDYKFFCFSGNVRALFVATERQKEGEDVKFDFFSPGYEWLNIKQGHENASEIPQKPSCFEEMKFLAEKLSKDFCQARIDFYEVNGKVYFGEITFYHHGGWTPFEPENWDVIFGEWIDLKEVYNYK